MSNGLLGFGLGDGCWFPFERTPFWRSERLGFHACIFGVDPLLLLLLGGFYVILGTNAMRKKIGTKSSVLGFCIGPCRYRTVLARFDHATKSSLVC